MSKDKSQQRNCPFLLSIVDVNLDYVWHDTLVGWWNLDIYGYSKQIL